MLVFGAWLSTSANAAKTWVVARSNLSAGTRLTPGDLTTEAMGLPSKGVGAQAFSDPASLLGRVLRAPLDAGELVQAGDIVPQGKPPPLRPVVISVPSPDVAGLSAGQAVDLLSTQRSGTTVSVKVVLRGARVLRVAAPSASALTSSGLAVVTLGVPDLADVEAVVAAQAAGHSSIVAAEPSDGVGLGPPPSFSAGGSHNADATMPAGSLASGGTSTSGAAKP